MFIEVSSIQKGFGNKENYVQVIMDMSLSLEEGKVCMILGPSGSGKSTLMNLIGGLDSPSEGTIKIGDQEISKLSSKERGLYRRNTVGFVFQSYNIISNLTVKENIEICKHISKNPLDIDELLERLGLEEHADKFPYQLSGGQQQRTAIGRALIKNPKLLLCDEPTGALDYKTSKDILKIIQEINQVYKTTILIITHNTSITPMAHKIISIKDGQIIESIENINVVDVSEIEW